VYSTEQRVFLIELYAKYSSYIKCRRKFQRKYPDSDVPSKSMIERLVKKFHSTGSVLDLKKRRRRSILTEEKLNEIWSSLERNPGRPLTHLAAQSGVSLGSVYTATRLLKWRSHTVILVQRNSRILLVVLGCISEIGCWYPCMVELLAQIFFSVRKHGCI
jgi:transposase